MVVPFHISPLNGDPDAKHFLFELGEKRSMWKEVLNMKKRLSCRDIGVNCDYVACGKTEEEVMKKVSGHARTGHNRKEIPTELQDNARSSIRDVEHC